jgi:hypothetical protein
MEKYEDKIRQGGQAALLQLGLFFMNANPVYDGLRKIAARLNELKIPYAVAGGMALNAHGFQRATVDVDVLVTDEGLKAVHERLSGLGYLPAFPNSRQLRDTEHGVRIEFLITGDFPGDGKPKPVAFPDPATAAVDIDGIRYLSLAVLIELKLASGMTNPGRLRDLADVQELIRTKALRRDFAKQLNSYVRKKYEELWTSVQQDRE